MNRQFKIIGRTLALSAVVVALTLTVLAVSELVTGKLFPHDYPSGIPAAAAQLRALTVRTQDNADFPSKPNLPAQALRDELDALVSFADEYGYNAIFFEAVPACDAMYRSSILPTSAFWTDEQGAFSFFDPLRYLTDTAKEHKLQVYAMIDPFGVAGEGLAASSPAAKNPTWVLDGSLNPAEAGVQKLIGRVTDELTSNYDIAGVVLGEVDSAQNGTPDYAQNIAKIAAHAHDAIQRKDVQRLGMVLGGDALTDEAGAKLASAAVESGKLDFVVAEMPTGIPERETLTTRLAAWDKLCGDASTEAQPVTYYSMHTASDKGAFQHAIDNSLYYERQSGAAGIVINSYSALRTETRAAAYSLAATFAQQPPAATIDLTYSQKFAVTRPTETLTVRSDMEQYFITGTSDPALPVLYKGKELDRPNDVGLWGALVKVPYGTTEYTFSQGGVTKTATIVRNEPVANPVITTITKSSVYPDGPEVVLDGTMLKLSCNAPAGGTVTATVGGLTATLEQVAATTRNGVAAKFQAQLDVSSLGVAAQVKNIGAITYRLNYAGLNSSQQSAGEVYVAGTGAKPIVKMKTFIVPISQNGKDDGVYSTILKKDCVDYIAENGGGYYYKLASGGYVAKSAVDIPEGAVSAKNTVSAISLTKTPKGEKIVLSGTTRPAFRGTFAENVLTLRLENISGFDKVNTALLESALCTSIDSEIGETDGSVTLTFTLREDARALGWDVQFDGSDTVIYLRVKPTFHVDSAKPLSDMTILLDPGHGGTDPGAAGVPYHEGPMEAPLNLAGAYALQSRLTALGATVQLTQEDASVTLNDRMELAEKLDADLFISCHHNSLIESVDSNTVAGIEVYYYNDQSKLLAETIGASLSEDTGRKLRFVEQSWYRVTMMTARPAVLVESGYICSPAEYDKIVSDFSMFQYANSVADAVVQVFRQSI